MHSSNPYSQNRTGYYSSLRATGNLTERKMVKKSPIQPADVPPCHPVVPVSLPGQRKRHEGQEAASYGQNRFFLPQIAPFSLSPSIFRGTLTCCAFQVYCDSREVPQLSNRIFFEADLSSPYGHRPCGSVPRWFYRLLTTHFRFRSGVQW